MTKAVAEKKNSEVVALDASIFEADQGVGLGEHGTRRSCPAVP